MKSGQAADDCRPLHLQSAIGITAPTETGSASVVKTFSSNSLINNERIPQKPSNPRKRVSGGMIRRLQGCQDLLCRARPAALCVHCHWDGFADMPLRSTLRQPGLFQLPLAAASSAPCSRSVASFATISRCCCCLWNQYSRDVNPLSRIRRFLRGPLIVYQ